MGYTKEVFKSCNNYSSKSSQIILPDDLLKAFKTKAPFMKQLATLKEAFHKQLILTYFFGFLSVSIEQLAVGCCLYICLNFPDQRNMKIKELVSFLAKQGPALNFSLDFMKDKETLGEITKILNSQGDTGADVGDSKGTVTIGTLQSAGLKNIGVNVKSEGFNIQDIYRYAKEAKRVEGSEGLKFKVMKTPRDYDEEMPDFQLGALEL
mmetsp:Transcript_36333/g.35221  ORF Transcript_36333/g.35221 Transcript_36333/m.35221 type:complete len:208 (-) Transcript_36333:609-1232(-)